MPSLFSRSSGASNSIDGLKSMVTKNGGFAMPTLFKVVLPSANVLGMGGSSASNRDLNLLCTGVDLPGRQIMTNDREIGGVMQKVANNSLHADINMTFRVMNDYGIKEYFDGWQSLCVDQGNTSGSRMQLRYASEYQHQIQIHQLKKGFGIPIYKTALPMPRLPSEIMNRLPKIDILGGALGNIDFAQGELELGFKTQDQSVYECTLIDAFPTSINAIQFNDATSNSIIEFNIQMSYRRWFGSANGSGNMGALQSIVSTVKNVLSL